MTDILLYMAPGTCARVSAIALEEAGLEFKTHLIRFMKGEHKSPAYKKINPLGKVPSLAIDDVVLTENVAIITYLNQRFPEAKLMPEGSDLFARAQQLADLSFCSSTLHPIVTRIRMPQFFASNEAVKSVWGKGCEAMSEYFKLIDERLSEGPWWYGENWSAIDAYLYWIYWRVEGADFPVGNYASFQDHKSRMELRPAVQKALAREAEAIKQLESEGLTFTPPKIN